MFTLKLLEMGTSTLRNLKVSWRVPLEADSLGREQARVGLWRSDNGSRMSAWVSMWPSKHKKSEPPTQADRETQFKVLSVLTPEDVEHIGGLPAEAIAGAFGTRVKDADILSDKEERLSVARFRPNAVFADFMHRVIATYGPSDPDLQAAAAEQGSGFLYIVDLRTPESPTGRVSPEDIVGAFTVDEGKIDDYRPNPNHLLFTEHGLVCLPPSLAALHLRELKRLKVR